jgi:hypothetical protein
MADVKVPLLGNMPRGAVLAGGLAVVAVGGYLAYKHFTTKSVPPTGTPYAYGYGASAYGAGSNVPFGYGYGYGAYSPYGTGGFGGGYPGGGYYGYTGGGPGPTVITTNAQWGQAAEAAMGSSGTDSIAAAIAKYLFGGTLDENQAQIVQEAIAVTGYPPVPGPGNYPPQMHVSGKRKHKGGGNATNPPTGLHVTKEGSTGTDIAWNASSGATSYQVTSTHGSPEMIGTTSARIRSIGPKHTTAVVQVLAEPAATNAKPAHMLIRVK